ncbi:hypothetical protein VNN41_11345 (plasmid) [Lactococcus garvieae]|uniref:hypothetical protein n=1 Tax=Lactococcus garvieae TaxID=1363 RepID=UPI00311AE1C7
MNAQTQAQAYLNRFKVQGKTLEGQEKMLDAKAIGKNQFEEFILIKHKAEGGVEIKGQFLNDVKPTEEEKLLFLIGEACYAAAMKYTEPSHHISQIPGSKTVSFEAFMRNLTDTVKKYHKIN